MFRLALNATLRLRNLTSSVSTAVSRVPSLQCNPSSIRQHSSLLKLPIMSQSVTQPATSISAISQILLRPPPASQSAVVPVRSLTKFSLIKGKRKSCKAVIKRFMRLNWGGWIRTKSGRNKKMWKKSPANRRRLRQHVFVNGSQSWKLDSMVGQFWRRPRFYASTEDPYWNYHTRDEFYATRRRPLK